MVLIYLKMRMMQKSGTVALLDDNVPQNDTFSDIFSREELFFHTKWWGNVRSSDDKRA